MTFRAAQRATGCVIEIENGEDGYFVVAIKDGKPVATAGGSSLKKSLQSIVNKVYEINRQKAYEKADYRCARCGEIVPLQAHHIKHRARGQRDDSVDNLEVLCSEHHDKEHGGKR